ncbi:MAG TPA: cytochrome c biogenesis protein ResB [Actinocrinis sp.]|nr:cytochrome c biogenesis protein ResB [Actinocrinis sp.]
MTEQTKESIEARESDGEQPQAPDQAPAPVPFEDADSRLSTAPADGVASRPQSGGAIAFPRLGFVGMVRWMWRQLTSMRIALTLLFMLSIAAIPGSLLPQTPVNPSEVAQYFVAHPHWANIFNSLQLFDVFESAWFGAIYTLLFISLVGCIVPRSLAHLTAMRGAPPAAPKNLRRLPVHASFSTMAEDAEILAAARRGLRRKRFRTVAGDGWIASEKGYLRETGNLVFHLSLIGILTAVAIGHFFGFKGAVLVTEGQHGFADAVANYDTLTMGQMVGPGDLPPFSLQLDKFTATYETSRDQYGAPRTFDAYVTFQATPTGAPKKEDLQVNQPIDVNGTDVYLSGHGYAPVVTVRDGTGTVVYSGPTTFLEADSMFTSNGAIKVPDANPKTGQGLGFEGLFLPTANIQAGQMPSSAFPAALNPVLILSVFAGNLGMNGGEDQNVYALDVTKMKQVDVKSDDQGGGNALVMSPGQTETLPNHLGSITFTGVDQWVQLNMNYDPGQTLVLVSAVLAVLGLIASLGIRRRRIWVRVTGQPDGSRLVEVAGLARTEGGTPTAEVTDLAQKMADTLKTVPATSGDPAGVTA